MDLIGNSAVTIRDYGTLVHKRKPVLELTQRGFPTNRPPRWLALYGYLRLTTTSTREASQPPSLCQCVFFCLVTDAALSH